MTTIANQMSIGQVRVVDPILTRVAQGYVQPDLVGRFLFPAVPVQLSGGRILQFGKEAFMRYNTARAPGTAYKRVQFGYEGLPYVLENHGIEAVVPREWLRDASVQPGINLGVRAVNLGMRIHALELENQHAGLATTAGNLASGNSVTLSGSSQWDDGGHPIDDITEGREVIRSQLGVYPNVAVFGPAPWEAFCNNPDVTDRIKYVERGVITEDIAAALLKVDKVYVGKAVSANAAGAFSDVWGNNCVLGYTAIGDINAEVPTAGYTYTMEGHPLVEPAYFDQIAKSWVYPGAYERSPVIAANAGFYLIQTPSAAAE